MPETTITIDRDQRAGLYELVRNHLGSIEDFWIALERTRDFAKAEQLGLEFSEDFRLLQDIGWHQHDERETFELTMPVSRPDGTAQARCMAKPCRSSSGRPAARRGRVATTPTPIGCSSSATTNSSNEQRRIARAGA